MSTATNLVGRGFVDVQANKDEQDMFIEDYQQIKKDMIAEIGDKIVFRLLVNRKTEHGGVVSGLTFSDYITDEIHKVRVLTEKDVIVKSGLMSMEDIYIEAPYDTQLKDNAEYYYRTKKYTILHTTNADSQGKTGYKKAYGKRIPQQDDIGDTTD